MYFPLFVKFSTFISEVSFVCIFYTYFTLFSAKRCSLVEIDEPWGNFTIERSMPSLKFYHDLTFGMYFKKLLYFNYDNTISSIYKIFT